ncbi:hypothetical protein LY28_01442 [Ruminiclostridium sufflavum DSM 19573]|uniref:Uncharacterized protein n=1 Tax=Ruminiclostridium sufflavum DSM 19573 TaxID=1121337 RepID=A0A318XNU4_9FIRM|nr:hypothetical protein [Ruminiclostridium sufflavum]PYG88591.1 hypothetical protein LY28_01442 [Ruminiclostridium sufflavum DSM 19573]
MYMITNYFTNLLLNSILEESYVVIATLILLGMAMHISFNIKMLASILIPAVISNFLRYFLSLDMTLIFIIFVLVMVLTICIIYNQKSLKKVFIVFTCVSAACMTNAMLEIANYKIIMLCTNITEETLKENIVNAFFSSLPIRLIEISIIIIYIKKHKYIDKKLSTSIWHSILKDKEQSMFAVIASFFNILWIVASVKVFVLDKFLINGSFNIKTSLLILMGDIIVPIMIYICFFFSVYNIMAKEAYIERLNRDLDIARKNMSKNDSHRHNKKGSYY